MKSRCLLTQVHRGPVWGATGDCVTLPFWKSSSLLGEEINLDYKPRTCLFTDTKCSSSALQRQQQIRQKKRQSDL